MNEKYLDFEYLKQHSKLIHSFGLGFIQIKLSDTLRVHVYCKEVVITTSPQDLHDHRYNFHSTILKGALTNEIYFLAEGGSFIMRKETCKASSRLASADLKPEFCSIKLLNKVFMAHGSSYFMEKDTIHRVEASRCISLVKRDLPSKDLALVISSRSSLDYVCPFFIRVAESELWKIVKKELKDVY